jgi:prevent-host-death family protein
VKIKIKETSMSFTTLRRSGADVIDRVRLTRERVLITNYGKPVAAMVSMEDLEILRKVKAEVHLELMVDEMSPTPEQIENFAAVSAMVNGPRALLSFPITAPDHLTQTERP